MTFKKPEQIKIDIMEYLKSITGGVLIKDLQEGEIVCPVCQGTGLMVDDNVYGLSDDKDKRIRFPYKKQSIVGCRNCYNGVVALCSYCGEQLNRGWLIHDCEGARNAKRQKEEAKELERFEKSIKLNYDDPIVIDMEFMWSDNYGYNEGYFNDWDEFFEYIQENEVAPRGYVWGTKRVEFELDVDSILENATSGLHENSYGMLTDTKELYDFAEAWSKKQTYATTYYMDYKYSIMIPWKEYGYEI